MKRIGITGYPNFPIDEWSKKTITLADLFSAPSDLTPEEIHLARSIMNIANLESDNNEGLIEIISTPSDFMSFIIGFKRILDRYQQQYRVN